MEAWDQLRLTLNWVPSAGAVVAVQIWPKIHTQIVFSLVLAQLVLVFILAIKKVIIADIRRPFARMTPLYHQQQ